MGFNMPRILVVDDEQHIVELIKFNLLKEGWTVDTAFDGKNAVKIAEANKPDIIVLDVMLPEFDGIEVCRRLQIREATADIPVIMLSAKSEELDRVLGLEIGADDYMTKPFSPRELIARIKARLRRKVRSEKPDATETERDIMLGNILIKPDRFEAFTDDKKLDLTLKEFELLKLLITNAGRVFTREILLDRVWGYEYLNDTRTVDVHIRHLRQKIEKDPNDPKLIQTIRGVGYKFKVII